jgi:hypothetical protein
MLLHSGQERFNFCLRAPTLKTAISFLYGSYFVHTTKTAWIGYERLSLHYSKFYVSDRRKGGGSLAAVTLQLNGRSTRGRLQAATLGCRTIVGGTPLFP